MREPDDLAGDAASVDCRHSLRAQPGLRRSGLRPRVTPMTCTPLTRAEKVDAATPESLNRVIDFLRAAVVTVVVLGHWTIIAVDPDGGICAPRRARRRPLDPSAHLGVPGDADLLPGGRLLQRPLLALRAAQGRGVRAVAAHEAATPRNPADPSPAGLAGHHRGLRSRLRTASDGAVRLPDGVDPHLVPRRLSDGHPGRVPVLREQFGSWAIIDGIALAGAGDALSIAADQDLLGYPNYLLVEAAFHQVGYAWFDGRRLLLAAIGLVGCCSSCWLARTRS